MQEEDPDIWSSPEASAAEPDLNAVSRVFAVIGSTVALLPVPMLAYTAVSLLLNYRSMVDTAEGDPQLMSGLLSEQLVPLVLSLLVGLGGFLIAICAAGFGGYKTRWFFWALIASALIYLVAFPVGTVLSLVAAVVVFRNRTRFLGGQVSERS